MSERLFTCSTGIRFFSNVSPFMAFKVILPSERVITNHAGVGLLYCVNSLRILKVKFKGITYCTAVMYSVFYTFSEAGNGRWDIVNW